MKDEHKSLVRDQQEKISSCHSPQTITITITRKQKHNLTGADWGGRLNIENNASGQRRKMVEGKANNPAFQSSSTSSFRSFLGLKSTLFNKRIEEPFANIQHELIRTNFILEFSNKNNGITTKITRINENEDINFGERRMGVVKRWEEKKNLLYLTQFSSNLFEKKTTTTTQQQNE